MAVRVEHADCRDAIRLLADASVDSVVTDPPYSLQTINKRFAKVGRDDKTWSRSGPHQRTAAGFMNQKWDTGETAFDPAFWAEVLRVLKPGGHLIAFSGTRTYHRLACAIEDAGFEIRDQIGWLYGSGFPKSHSVSKAIDKALGTVGAFGAAKSAAHERYIEKGELRGHDGWQRPWMDDPEAVANAGRQYIPGSPEAVAFDGFGTALKPAWEPIVLARKPLIGTVAANVLQHGTGAINIDGCRVAATDNVRFERAPGTVSRENWRKGTCVGPAIPVATGRWPANVIHDGSDEVLAAFPESASSPFIENDPGTRLHDGGIGKRSSGGFQGTGSAARFFYSAKADATDRLGSKHPTVKPVDLMAYLCRLITPPGGTVLDPFAGSGTTGMACLREGFDCILFEREAAYVADIQRRLQHVEGGDTPLFAAEPCAQAPLL